MRLGTAALLLGLVGLAVGCGPAGDTLDRGAVTPSAFPSEADSRRSSPEAPSGPSADERAEREARRAERRARYEAQVAQRCDPLLPRLGLTYRITATPVASGTAIGLHLTLANRTVHSLYGGTAGAMELDPGRGSLAWGGSSADEMELRPGTTLERHVWHERLPPGTNPVGDRVTSFTFYTYLYAPKPGGTLACYLPARIQAPRGLVDGHPAGRWSQPSELPWQS